MRKPLEGIRVIDLTRVLAGPYCTALLADLGAEVIKIERPGVGDDARHYVPFVKGQSAYFININRGKKSVVIDLKKPKGRELFFRLVEKADVLVENFAPGTMERLGLGYDAVNRVNPRIVYASISGFGQEGPYRRKPAYDLIAQAMGGIMSITGWPDSPPTRVGTAIGDILGALYATIAILAALRAREITGRGERIDIAMVDCVIQACEAYNMMWLVEGRIPTRIGNRYEFIYPYDTFRARDGWVAIGVGNDEMWARLCKAMGREDLMNHEDFNTNMKRVINHVRVKEIVERWTSKLSVREIVEALEKHEIPVASVYTMKDVWNDEHIVKWRRMLVKIEQPGVGEMPIVGTPFKFNNLVAEVGGPAPLLGQHTEEVLTKLLNLSEEEINELEREGIIYRGNKYISSKID
jgi:crotonobetainyl-CoA:carnitine CoA-transferase CaiB-like acyl-CoA transferase